ncbi:MAG TPA: patatin-like phospholipase family protein [Thermoanaerobaculia bacterium]|nr:patatin-like phospholipase family protein [Thermoanaerobaculia bacterium]
MSKRSFIIAGALLAAMFSPALRAEDVPRRPKIGIAFAGGGARGGAHVGVLKVLEELHIPVDYVAGTSIGSIVAALYATGMSPDEMEKVLSTTDWDDALQDDEPRRERPFRAKQDDAIYLVKAELGFKKRKLVLPGGLVAGQKLGYLLRRFTLPASEVTDFDRLPIPFRAVATDIVTGDPVVLGKGDVARAVRASMAIPGFFSPVELDGRLLVDGGSSDNLPIDVVRRMGADVIIAIDISTPLSPRENLNTFLAITGQTSGFLTRLNVLEQIKTLEPKDVLITPDLHGISTLAFADFPKSVGRGESAGRKAAESLKKYAVSETEYAEFRRRQRVPRTAPTIDAVRIAPVAGVDPRLTAYRVRSKPGPLEWRTVEHDLAKLYETGKFQTVDFRVVHEGGQEILVYQPTPKPPAPDRLRFGLKLDTDFAGDSSFGLRLGFYKTSLNALQAELRTKLEVGLKNSLLFEFYQPTDYRGRFFLSPTVEIARQTQDVFQGDDQVAKLLQTSYGGKLDAGISLGNLGEIRVGGFRAQSHIETDIFTSPPREATENVAGGAFHVILDQLDSVTFPRDGWFARTDVTLAGKALGATWEYGTVGGTLAWAKSFDQTTIVPTIKIDSRLGPDARPYFDLATEGGFLNLSGLKPGQLRGQYGGVARIVAYQRLARFNSLIGTGIYAGGSVETGNVWQDSVTFSKLRFAGSVFVSADTLIGPLYLGYGLADGGHGSAYLALGFPLN